MDKKKITLELNLLDNAFDSLGEAIIKLCNQQEKITNLKFAISHIAHFVELFLKYYVTKQHKLLIYTNPSKVSQDQIKKGDATTITLDQAICILKKCNIDIGSALESDVNTLKEHRNKIMHYKFNPNFHLFFTPNPLPTYIQAIFTPILLSLPFCNSA